MRIRRLCILMVVAALLCALPSAQAASREGIDNLLLTLDETGELRVQWDNPDEAICEVRVRVAEQTRHQSVSTKSGSAKFTLVPGVAYDVVVEDRSENGATLTETIEVPEAASFKGYGYRVEKRRVYHFVDAEKSMWNQSYNNLGTVTKEEILAGLSSGRIYALYFEATFSKTSEPKVITPLLALKTPSGDVFARASDSLAFDASWTGVRYYFSFNDLLLIINSSEQGLAPGKYSMEAYESGALLGKGEFSIKE